MITCRNLKLLVSRDEEEWVLGVVNLWTVNFRFDQTNMIKKYILYKKYKKYTIGLWSLAVRRTTTSLFRLSGAWLGCLGRTDNRYFERCKWHKITSSLWHPIHQFPHLDTIYPLLTSWRFIGDLDRRFQDTLRYDVTLWGTCRLSTHIYTVVSMAAYTSCFKLLFKGTKPFSHQVNVLLWIRKISNYNKKHLLISLIDILHIFFYFELFFCH